MAAYILLKHRSVLIKCLFCVCFRTSAFTRHAKKKNIVTLKRVWSRFKRVPLTHFLPSIIALGELSKASLNEPLLGNWTKPAVTHVGKPVQRACELFTFCLLTNRSSELPRLFPSVRWHPHVFLRWAATLHLFAGPWWNTWGRFWNLIHPTKNDDTYN